MNSGTNEILGIDSLELGIDSKGMDDYKESLRLKILEESKTIIRDYSELEAALNKGWQGKSFETFKKQFTVATEDICDDLDKEYEDLEARLDDLKAAYFNVDRNIMGEE